MANDRKAIALELRQIIQADRMAVDTIRRAEDMRATIEKQTERDKAEILRQAEEKRQEITRRVEAGQADALAKRKAEAEKQFAAQRAFIGSEMEKNKARWVEEITARITGEDTL